MMGDATVGPPYNVDATVGPPYDGVLGPPYDGGCYCRFSI